MFSSIKKHIPTIVLVLFCFVETHAQPPKKHISLKDSLDKKFDLSDYVIEAKGFIPVASIITEPALGGFGVVLAPVFIKRRPPYVDTIHGKEVHTPIQPDITGAVGLISLNGSWGALAFRSGTLIKSRIKYMIGGGFINLNMSYFKTLPELGDKEMKFNIKNLPLLLQGIKRIGFSHWYAGGRYLFMDSKLEYEGDHSIDSIAKKLEKENLLSQIGGIIELDNRDNIF